MNGNDMLKDFIIWAEAENWHLTRRTEACRLPDCITERYQVPSAWLDFIPHFSQCSNSTDTKWFLTFEDFIEKDKAFQWNEFEQQSIEAAGTDSRLRAEITAYWVRHLPIVMCVDGEYAYYAIDTENGNVVFGCEPEYEEPTVIADDFDTFMQKLIAGEITL